VALLFVLDHANADIRSGVAGDTPFRRHGDCQKIGGGSDGGISDSLCSSGSEGGGIARLG